MPSTNIQWLSLIDYANKYKVSISTLRRKIKIEDIPFRLESGKYYIVDEPLDLIGKAQGSQLELDNSRDSKLQMEEEFAQAPKNIAEQILDERRMVESEKTRKAVDSTRSGHEGGESVLVAANRLLDEIKKAYTLILQEKDEQIRQFRDEITDLKTLVRVLEGENERLKKESKGELFFEDIERP